MPEIEINTLGPLHLGTIAKSLFSMVTPELQAALQERNIKSVIITGIEVVHQLYWWHGGLMDELPFSATFVC